MIRRVLRREPAALRSTRRGVIKVLPCENLPAVRRHFLTRLPFNETLQLEIAEKELQLARLAPSLDGLSILHLSDLHYSGRIAKRYFEEVAEQANGMKPDLVAVTGDLIDHNDYIDWMPDTLGKLYAPLGVYFILGNHDRRYDWSRLRQVLTQCGLVDLGADGSGLRLADGKSCWRGTSCRGFLGPPISRSPRGHRAKAGRCGSCWRTARTNFPGLGRTRWT